MSEPASPSPPGPLPDWAPPTGRPEPRPAVVITDDAARAASSEPRAPGPQDTAVPQDTAGPQATGHPHDPGDPLELADRVDLAASPGSWLSPRLLLILTVVSAAILVVVVVLALLYWVVPTPRPLTLPHSSQV